MCSGERVILSLAYIVDKLKKASHRIQPHFRLTLHSARPPSLSFIYRQLQIQRSLLVSYALVNNTYNMHNSLNSLYPVHTIHNPRSKSHQRASWQPASHPTFSPVVAPSSEVQVELARSDEEVASYSVQPHLEDRENPSVVVDLLNLVLVEWVGQVGTLNDLHLGSEFVGEVGIDMALKLPFVEAGY